MELSNDLVAVQGILISVMKTSGEFTKIRNKGGNEQKILDVLMEIQKFLSNKNYVQDGKVNYQYDKNVGDIVFFLAINTTYKEPLDLEDYSHLMNIMPQLSKCLLVNIVYGLDLSEYYCRVMEKLPISYGIELLEETIPCLEKSVPKIQLLYAHMFLKTSMNKLVTIGCSKQLEDHIDQLTMVTDIILRNLTGLYLDQAKNLKSKQIYEHMGYCLLRLFELLLYHDKDHPNLKKFIANILRACCSVVKNITINVFCCWAEIEEDDEPLQQIITEKAYAVIEEYQKCEEAKELLSMLRPMAKKPNTLAERIQAADVTKIIKYIDKGKEDQKSWFKALLSIQVFQNDDAVDCLSMWTHLCDEEDVVRLLNLSYQSKCDKAKNLTIRCAANLSLDKLITVMARYYYKYKFSYVFNEDVQSQLMPIFNKITDDTRRNDQLKKIILLMLENPTVVLNYIYSECLKNSFYTNCLKNMFVSIRDFIKINKIGISTFQDTMIKIKPSLENVDNYVKLFKTLSETKYFSSDTIFTLISHQLERCKEDNDSLTCALYILLEISIRIPVKEDTKTLIQLLIHIMNENRCSMVKFKMSKQQNVKYIVDIIMKLCQPNRNSLFKVEPETADDDFTAYYKKYLSCETDMPLLNHFWPEFSPVSHGKCVGHLLKIFPRAVTLEWLSVTEEIYRECGCEKTIELLVDVMILLCEIVQTQDVNDDIFNALKYYLQQFGMVIQQKILVSSPIEAEVSVTRHICRLLRYIPDPLKEEEGLILVNLLTDRSLQSLANDRKFLSLLIMLNNPTICKVLAQKISS